MITNLRDSKARLSELVERAAGGETILITVRGRPKARLVGVEATRATPDMAKWVEELAALQDQYSTSSNEKVSVLDDLRGERW